MSLRVPRRLALVLATGALAGLPATAHAEGAGCSKVASPGAAAAQDLVNSLSVGETGCLRAGTYQENVKISKAGITLRSYPGERATVLGRFWIARGAEGVTVAELVLNGRNERNNASPTVNADRATFVNNDVTNDHTAICFLLGNPGYGDARGTTIARNRIHDCGKLPANGHEHGIYAENASDTKIAGNWIYDNADWGIHLYPNAQRSEITGNVVDGNGMGLTFSGEGSEASSDNLLERNVLSNATRGYNVESWFGGVVGSGNLARGNCLYGGRNSVAGGVQLTQVGFQALDNVVAAPEFVNREGKDFRLGAGSRCRSLLPEPDSVPGPGGSSQPVAPVAPAAPAASSPPVVLTAPRTVRRGRSVPLSGRVAPSRVRPGLRVSILVRRGRSWRRLAGTKVRANGKFRVKKSLRASRRTRSLRLRASVRGVGASRAVRLTLR